MSRTKIFGLDKYQFLIITAIFAMFAGFVVMFQQWIIWNHAIDAAEISHEMIAGMIAMFGIGIIFALYLYTKR